MKTINLSGDVGWEITDRLVNSLLPKDGQEDVNVVINSVGGDVFEAFAIFNTLKSYPGNLTTTIKSVAASAAGVIFLAGKKKAVYKNSTFMAHPAWGCICGNGDEMMSWGKVLNDLSAVIADELALALGKPKAQVIEEMKNEIWLIGWEQITAAGIADEVIDLPASESDSPEPVDKISAEIKNIQNKLRAREEESYNAKLIEKVAASIAARVQPEPDEPEPQNPTPHGEIINTEENMTVKEVLDKFPDTHEAILNEGKKIATDEGVNTALDAERKNTREMLILSGISKEIAENCTSGITVGDFAKAELEKQVQARASAAAAGGKPAITGVTAGVQTPADSAIDEPKSEVEKQKKAWNEIYGKKEAE